MKKIKEEENEEQLQKPSQRMKHEKKKIAKPKCNKQNTNKVSSSLKKHYLLKKNVDKKTKKTNKHR